MVSSYAMSHVHVASVVFSETEFVAKQYST